MGFDPDLIELAIRRQPVLETLSEGPHHRRDLEEKVDLSKTTCHRIISRFDDHDLLERGDDGYSLTALGSTVVELLATFEDNLRTAARLHPLLEAFETAGISVDIERFTDVTITRSEPEDPSAPIHRYLELYRDAGLIRTVERSSFVPPLYLKRLFDLAFENESKRGVLIYPKRVVEDRYEQYPEIHREVVEQDFPMRYRVYEGCPFGMTIYDRDHVGFRAYDEESGALVLFADTDDPATVAWAEEIYEAYYDQSEPLSKFDSFPDWVPDSEIYDDIV